MQNKLPLEEHLKEVLHILLNKPFNLTFIDILNIILHINFPYIIKNNSTLYYEHDNLSIDIKNNIYLFEESILNRFYIKDKSILKEYIKYNYSSYLPDNQKSHLGKYYTPKILVDKIKKIVSKYIDSDTYIMDLACGAGAFLDDYENTENIIGRDIDKQAIDILDLLEFRNIKIDNSLYNVNREKYNINDNEKIIIVGNPPYNDIYSKNKRNGINKKEIYEVMKDEDIKFRDLGVCFFKMYAKLNPDYICIVHPLSYLIKKTNFSNLKEFKNKYKLKESYIFSSKLFLDLNKSTNAEFPLCISLFEKGSMDYEYICNFNFLIFDNDSTFILNKIETIDGYIRKYPILRNKEVIKSDINLYMYAIRDTNSLLTSGNLKEGIPNKNYITIMYKDLYKYAYLSCIKKFFKSNYLFGNISPIVNKNDLETNIYLQDLCIMGMILKNQRLHILNKTNNESLIYTKLYNDFLIKSNNFKSNQPNIYNVFLNYCIDKDSNQNKELIYNEITMYFNEFKINFIKS